MRSKRIVGWSSLLLILILTVALGAQQQQQGAKPPQPKPEVQTKTPPPVMDPDSVERAHETLFNPQTKGADATKRSLILKPKAQTPRTH